MKLQQESNTLEDDVGELISGYLERILILSQKTSKGKNSELAQLQEELAQLPHDKYEKLRSLAIQKCDKASAVFEDLPKLRNKLFTEQCNNRKQLTLKSSPNLHIRFQSKKWSEYYQGTTNIKYPPVINMHACELKTGKCVTCDYKVDITKRIGLFDMLQFERHMGCQFNPNVLIPVEFQNKKTDYPAIIIPSGGKNQEWLGSALKKEEFWWTKKDILENVQVFFVVSDFEVKTYQEVLSDWGICVIGYEGFGMGCGRAAGVSVAKKLQRVCFMTDDRTNALTFDNKKQTGECFAKQIKLFAEKLVGDIWIQGVGPKFELNILTVINPKATCKIKPTFPKYFIASKEDKVLHLYLLACQVRNKIAPAEDRKTAHCLTADCWELKVSTDTNNPPVKNNAVKYGGKKGESLQALTASNLYKTCEGTSLTWKTLSSNQFEFKNQWDAIKMQDSAMFQLLEEILKKLIEEDKEELWKLFDEYITPWFT